MRLEDMIPVRLPNGVVVMHTRAEFDRYWKGVDREVAKDADSKTPLREEHDGD